MGRFIKTQSNFSSGEISKFAHVRNDLKNVINGVSKLQNMDVLVSGGIRRRSGTVLVDEIVGKARLFSFVFRDDMDYLCVLTDRKLTIYDDDIKIAELDTIWDEKDLNQIQSAQRFSQMIFVHTDYMPQVLKRNADGKFSIANIYFDLVDSMRCIPFAKFDDNSGVSLKLGTSELLGHVRLYVSEKNHFKQSDIGSHLRFYDGEFIIRVVTDEYIDVSQNRPLKDCPTGFFPDWQEGVFSPRRGFPSSVTFHQNRLVFGGTRDVPCGVWLSKTGNHFNFNVGNGLDDDAISLMLLSHQQQKVVTVVSGTHLQVLTSIAEWSISGDPITPTSIQIQQQTNVGSYVDSYLAPQSVEGSTVFVSRSGNEIRELVLDKLNGTYSAQDLAVLSSHLMNRPLAMAYHNGRHQLFVVCGDGSIAVLTYVPSVEVAAWSVYRTAGIFKSLAIVMEDIYVVVDRDEKTYLEKFDNAVFSDCGKYKYTHCVAGLPMITDSMNLPKKIRIDKCVIRVLDTKSINVDFGDGSKKIALDNSIYADDNPGYSGDVSVGVLGTMTKCDCPLWSIVGDEELPITVLSVLVSGNYI